MAPRPTGRRSRSPARLRRRGVVRRRGGGMMWGAVGLGAEKSTAAASPPLLLLLLLLAPKAAMAEDSGVTSEEEEEDGEGGPSAHSDMAKSVEQYLPMFLGLLLFLAVVGWCAMNVIRASRRQNRELEEAEAAAAAKDSKASGSTRARPRSISDRHDSLRQDRGEGGTGNVSPEGVDSTYQKKRSLRGSAAVSGHQHGTLHGNGGVRLIPETIFNGDELQGKKAPGEQGDVYQNPMQRARVVSSPGHSDGTAYSSGSVSSRFSSTQASRAAATAAASKAGVGRGRPSGRISSKGLTGTLTGKGFSSGNDDDADEEEIGGVFDMMEMGRSRVVGEGSKGGGRGKKSGRKGDGGDRSRKGRMMSRTFSGRGNRSGAGEAPQATAAEADPQESDLSRNLRPAVLRAGRPIPRNPSNAGIERGSAR
ncbi:unnamed protein product [Ectocarpus sp. 4 AP-2014]